MIGVVLGILVTAAPVVLLVLLVRRLTRPHAGAVDGRSVRRFFQYALLYGLLLVVAIGVTGLLVRLVESPPTVFGDDTDLARSLTFTVVGMPMLAGVVLWTRVLHRRDPAERDAPGWAVYLTVAGLTALVMAMADLHGVVSPAVTGRWAPDAGVAFLVWGGIWAVHAALLGRTVPAGLARGHLAVGSLIGLVTLLVGLASVLADAGRVLVVERAAPAFVSAADGGPVALAVVGALVWVWYWLLHYRAGPPDLLWLTYVLPVGVGASLVTAVVGSSLALYAVLVWVLGDPGYGAWPRHFAGTPAAVGAAVVGLASWWYHRQVLRASAPATRNDVVRLHDYLMAGISLVAAAAGLAVLVVAAIEALLPAAVVQRGASVANSLLAATTLLVVGGPLWWMFWRRIRRETARAVASEIASPVRRTYLLVLFGVGAVAAVVTVLVASYMAIRGALEGGVDARTWYEMRVPLGILVATAAVSGYHWRVYREDRAAAPRVGAERHGPRYVLLIGAPDDGVVAAVRKATRGDVRLWVRTDDPAPPWVTDEVVAAVSIDTHPALAVIGGADGIQSIPIQRP
ncbi:MAG: hypothetical protein H5T83_10230 [Actinotalea sp.]|nr:hypothetical protein [Actinotalea sp.]